MFWRAWYASQAGLVDDAERIYRSLIRRNPDNAWSYNALGYLLVQGGDYARLEEAVNLLEQAVTKAPNEPAIVHSYGSALSSLGDLENAAEHLGKAVELYRYSQAGIDDGTAAEILTSYGLALLSLGRDADFESFAGYLSSGGQEEGPRFGALVELSFFFASYKNRVDENIVEMFSDFTEVFPENPVIIIQQAYLLHKMGDAEAAELLLVRAGNLIDEDTPTDVVGLHALVLQETEITEEAEKVYRSLIERVPNNPWHYSFLGYLLADEGRELDEAEELLEKAREIAPDRPEIESHYAWVLHNNGKSQEAAAWAEKALSHEPRMDVYQYVTALVEYGEILWSLGYEDEASEAWNEASEIDSNHVDVLEILEEYALASGQIGEYVESVLGHAELLVSEEGYEEAYKFLTAVDLVSVGPEDVLRRQALYAERARLIDAARRIYRRLADINPEQTYYYHKLGFLANDYDSRAEAKALLERILQRSTDDASLTGTLSWVKYNQGADHKETTRENLSAAVEFAKSSPDYDLGIYVSLLARYGEILWESSMYSEAIEAWGEGLALDFEYDLRHEDLRQTLVKYAEVDGVDVRRDREKMADLNPGVLRTLKNAVEGLER